MNNFIIDTPDNFWQIRWLDKYMEGHKGFIAGGCFKKYRMMAEIGNNIKRNERYTIQENKKS